jgi:hypothetical protein
MIVRISVAVMCVKGMYQESHLPVARSKVIATQMQQLRMFPTILATMPLIRLRL